MPYLTLDSLPTVESVTIELPTDAEWWAIFIGALLELGKPENWEQYGTLTIDECSSFWDEILRAIQP